MEREASEILKPSRQTCNPLNTVWSSEQGKTASQCLAKCHWLSFLTVCAQDPGHGHMDCVAMNILAAEIV